MKFLIKCLTISICITSSNLSAHEIFTDHAWQTSMHEVTLHLRNKLLNDPYEVTFAVTRIKTGEVFKIEKSSGPNDWNKIRFPMDFDIKWVDIAIGEEREEYTWEAILDGRVVHGGEFIYPYHKSVWTQHD
ncbi:MAG: hypothetical protein ACJ0BW_02030 [Pontiellaceae bacterium]